MDTWYITGVLLQFEFFSLVVLCMLAAFLGGCVMKICSAHLKLLKMLPNLQLFICMGFLKLKCVDLSQLL